jgi:GDP-4-dehydro-6-deoxy-D-mannose reductase
MADTAVVTGASGFVGGHLIRELQSRGMNVLAVDQRRKPFDGVESIALDILDTAALTRLLDEYHPHFVFHLAAIASPRLCHADPALAFRVNLEGALSIYQAVRPLGRCRTLFIGTSHEYKLGADDRVELSEADSLGASSIYGLTKECAERALRTLLAESGTQLFFTRSFNHTGPGQSDDYAIGNFVSQALRYASGEAAEIAVGDIDVQRDILDVRDVVRAYISILDKGKPDRPYNVCAGRAISLNEILGMVVNAVGLEAPVVKSTGKGETTPSSLYGRNDLIRADCNWQPEIPLEQTVADMVECERRRQYGAKA